MKQRNTLLPSDGAAASELQREPLSSAATLPDPGTSSIGAAALAEATLDPENWSELGAQAHRMLDDMLLHLATVGERPAWQPVPQRVKQALAAHDSSLPRDSAPLASVYRQFVTDILPYTTGNRHPRAWGWVRGTGTPVAMLAEMLAAGINAHVGGGDSAPVLVEEQVLSWLARALEMPAGTSGLLTSGGTMANLLGLAVARHARAGYDVREEGLAGRPRMTFYCSRETHFWARKSVELLGLGRRSLREISVDAGYCINLPALLLQIEADRANGMQPIAIIANAGTVNTGAVDDLIALRALCDEQRLWLHIDGAFGALLKLAPAQAPLVRGLETADSLAFDLHKWMYLPFEVGCVLVRDAALHQAAFATAASYMEHDTRGMLAGGTSLTDRGIESSRGFKALKVWMSLRTHGLDLYGRLIGQNVEQARYLAALVEVHEELELATPCVTNIVCFRYMPPGAEWLDLDALQRELVLRLQESGAFVVSGTTLVVAGGTRYVVRVAVTNHRSRREDFCALALAVVETGRALVDQVRMG